MANIKNALNQIPEKIEALIKDYTEDLQKAWQEKEGDESLAIGFAATLSVDKAGKNKCDVFIAFSKGKVKDKLSFTWDDKQEKLPLKEKGKEK
jgi:hypothetical protein